MHAVKPSMTGRIVLLAAAFLALAAFLPGGAAAVGTPSGTIITNQATATYQDAGANNYSSASNTTQVTVQPVYSVAITSPVDQTTPAGATAYYAYMLTNTGNAPNTFNLSGSSAPPGWAVTLYADDGAGVGGIPNDGVHQPGETNVTATTGALAADATYRFFMAVTVPAGTVSGTTDVTTLSVEGTGIPGPGNADDATDPVTTTAGAPNLVVAKAVRNFTNNPGGPYLGAVNAIPTDVVEYQVTVTNSGPVAATSVVLTDPINSNTGFVVGTASFNAGTSGLTGATIEYANEVPPALPTWSYGPPASGGCGAPVGADYCVTWIRWTGTGTMLPGGTSFTTLFQVRVK